MFYKQKTTHKEGKMLLRHVNLDGLTLEGVGQPVGRCDPRNLSAMIN